MSSSVHWAEATSHFPTNSSKKALEPSTKVGHGKIAAASGVVLSAALSTSTLPLRKVQVGKVGVGKAGVGKVGVGKVGVGVVGVGMVGVLKETWPSCSGLGLFKRRE